MFACPVCHAYLHENSKQIPYPSDNGENKKNISFLNIIFCNNCGLGIAFPEISKDKLTEFYNDGSFGKRMSMKNLSFKSFPGYFALAKSRWNDIEQLVTDCKNKNHMKILDIGAGYGCIGLIANKSKSIGLDLYTCVEPDLIMNQYLRNNLKTLLNSQKIEIVDSINKISKQYDVVILSHVLEHVTDPLSMLKSAVSLLVPNGILLLDVPNRDYLFKKDVFPHVLFFSLETIKYIFFNERLIEVVLMEGRGSNVFILSQNKRAPLGPRLIIKLVQIFYRFISGRFLVLFFTWYFGANQVNPDGSWIRVLCRKKVSYEAI